MRELMKTMMNWKNERNEKLMNFSVCFTVEMR